MILKGFFVQESKPMPPPSPLSSHSPPIWPISFQRWRSSHRLPRWRTVSPSPLANPPTCPNCNSRLAAHNPATGGYYDHCSRACATQARGPGTSRGGGQVNSPCKRCKRRPRCRRGKKVYPYCGLTCANLAARNIFPRVKRPVNRAANLPTPADVHATPEPTPPDATCKTPGCALPVFANDDGTPGEYCTMSHKTWGEQGCVSCRAAPMCSLSVLCKLCHENALSKAPVIIEIPRDHKNYRSVETQFTQSWRHSTACPEVKAVYKVITTEASLQQYRQYLDGVETRGNFAAMGMPRGNEKRRWHGTKRKCNIGDKGNTEFCTDPGCSLCCIIKTSFDLSFFKGATGWGRFGRGIYTSSTSSKSHDYSRNVDITSEWNALLLNKVVVGNGKKLTRGDKSLTAAPAGYDSVLAEAVPGGALNYDELVVYQNDAVRPSYLIMYKMP